MIIERHVPVPEVVKGKGRGIYKFGEWQVGDSILLQTIGQADSAQTSAKAWADRMANGARFTRKKVEGGYRLWRVQ